MRQGELPYGGLPAVGGSMRGISSSEREGSNGLALISLGMSSGDNAGSNGFGPSFHERVHVRATLHVGGSSSG